MFQAGKPVSGVNLIGRQAEIDQLKAYLRIGQSVALIAPRRFGKTSLVREVLSQIKADGGYTGMVDIFGCPDLRTVAQEVVGETLSNHKLKQVFQKVKDSTTAMLRQVEIKSVIEDAEFIIGFADQTISEWSLLSDSIRYIETFTTDNNQQMAFAFDEIGDLSKYSNSADIIKLLRSEIQNQQNTCYIFSGSFESSMDAMFVNDKSPFYRMVRIMHLGYLPFADVKKYMITKLGQYDVTVPEKLIENIIDFLKGHPYYCQLALQQIYLYQATKKHAPTTAQLIEDIMALERSYLDRLWEDYSSSSELSFILRSLVNAPTGIFAKTKLKNINPSRGLKRLEGQGIIYKKDKGYYFYDPVWEYYLAGMG